MIDQDGHSELIGPNSCLSDMHLASHVFKSNLY